MTHSAGSTARRGPVLSSRSLPWAGRSAFTMAEMTVAVTIMVVVTAVVAGLFVQARKMVGITQWGAETRSQMRTTVSVLAEDLQSINDQAYFIMLNRDYQAARLNREGPADRTLPADRIAFVAQGPFNTMPGSHFGPGGCPAVASSARVYYGHSLYTHEWADAAWAAGHVSSPVTDNLLPPWNKYPTTFSDRPAVDWCLVRQAVLRAEDPAADIATPAEEAGVLRDNNARLDRDAEFRILYSPLELHTWADLTSWVDRQLVHMPSESSWLALAWAPRVHQTEPPLRWDPATAPARLLLPHAAKVRFQVRLSNGTIVPQVDDANPNPLSRGLLAERATDTTVVTGLTPGFDIDGTEVLNPAVDLTPPVTGMAAPISVKQYGYVWTGARTNVQSTPAPLYPVALRVRIEVYDPDKRTPDPIVVDEWLPIRWTSQPMPAP